MSFNYKLNTNRQTISMDNMCNKINDLQEELADSDRKLHDLTIKKKELQYLLANSSKAVQQLQSKLSRLQGEESEWKQREREVNGDIERLSAIIDEGRKSAAAKVQLETEEEQQIEYVVSSFEQDCHNVVMRLKLLFPRDEEVDSGNEIEEIKRLEEEIQDLENQIRNLDGEREKALPFSEMKILLGMANKEKMK